MAYGTYGYYNGHGYGLYLLYMTYNMAYGYYNPLYAK